MFALNKTHAQACPMRHRWSRVVLPTVSNHILQTQSDDTANLLTSVNLNVTKIWRNVVCIAKTKSPNLVISLVVQQVTSLFFASLRPLFVCIFQATMVAGTPGNTHPELPSKDNNGNKLDSPLLPPDSPKNNSPLIPPYSPKDNQVSPWQDTTVQALLNLAKDQMPLQDDPDFYKAYCCSSKSNTASSSTLPHVPATYSKLLEILTAAIKPMYNGSVPSFFTFLFQLKQRRLLCHFWSSTTYYTMVDLFAHFVDINFEALLFDLSR